jgi:hypothetical protein
LRCVPIFGVGTIADEPPAVTTGSETEPDASLLNVKYSRAVCGVKAR